ncbi:nucleoside hydrolase [Lachnospiraceae bacterium OttesenSCG-928-D06]|nr:nucleoside hydrolase [Lachnospiraceae bacterium OttesenSCG-928-D06]
MESPKPYLFTDNNPNTMEDYANSVKRLEKPKGKVDVILDSDMFNEVDDQFALAYLLQSTERMNLKAICAAPFLNHHSNSPLDGMEKSYEETFRILKMLKREEYNNYVYKGAGAFLQDEKTPIPSDAVNAMVELSKSYSPENPLYIIGIAAATNIASALLLCEEMKERVFVIWLGGMGFDWHDNKSFNAGQDVAAARVLLESGVPMVLLPGRGVVERFSTNGPELRHWLSGKNEFCDYIVEKTEREAQFCNGEECWSRPISDVTAVAWLHEENFMLDRLEHSPVMEYDHLYAEDKRRKFIRYVYSINRDKLMGDLFRRISRYE